MKDNATTGILKPSHRIALHDCLCLYPTWSTLGLVMLSFGPIGQLNHKWSCRVNHHSLTAASIKIVMSKMRRNTYSYLLLIQVLAADSLSSIWKLSTPFPIPSFAIFRQMFWVFSDRLVGRFCSYLLPERVLLDARNFKTLSQKIFMNDRMGNGVKRGERDFCFKVTKVHS